MKDIDLDQASIYEPTRGTARVTILDPPDIEANDHAMLKESPTSSTTDPTETTEESIPREGAGEASNVELVTLPGNKSQNTRHCCSRWNQTLDRARNHYQLEKQLLRRSWKVVFFALVFQYVHNVATNLVYYLHEPSKEPLQDLGFELLPALEKEAEQFVSEIIFIILIAITVSFALYPFVEKGNDERANPGFSVVMLTRYALVLVMAQTLRILSFLATTLPSPNYHCRTGAEEYDPPATAAEVFLRIDSSFGCGDLIFSSHTIFVTLGALLIHHYSRNRYLKAVVWSLVVTLGFLVVAARKHYTVDVVVAWYTCPLLWFYCAKTYKDDVLPNPQQQRCSNSLSTEISI